MEYNPLRKAMATSKVIALMRKLSTRDDIDTLESDAFICLSEIHDLTADTIVVGLARLWLYQNLGETIDEWEPAFHRAYETDLANLHIQTESSTVSEEIPAMHPIGTETANSSANSALITNETVSPEYLKELLDDAYIDCHLNEDGEICIDEGERVWISLPPSKSGIKLAVYFKLNEEATELTQLQFANKANNEYRFARCKIDRDMAVFDCELLLKGGITKQNFIHTLKFFSTLPRIMSDEFGDGIVI